MKGNFVSCQIITRAMAGLADALTDEHNGEKKNPHLIGWNDTIT